ncbi:MAG: hypothetical protein ACE5Z5_09665 [Candidatus Bathyarchaeia archaeon]
MVAEEEEEKLVRAYYDRGKVLLLTVEEFQRGRRRYREWAKRQRMIALIHRRVEESEYT